MKLFDKKFVRFMWDDELEGKKVFVADNINSLIERVEKGASIYKVRWSRDNGMPFEGDDLVRYRFAYYDPNYEAKRAFNEGKEIQFKDDVSGDWCSAYNPRWDLNIEYRIKPKNNCVAYLARLSDDDYYLTACYENRWESVQKGYGAKTKLFVGSEGEVREWYESREKFKDLIKAWEDDKTIQVYEPLFKKWSDCAGTLEWYTDCEYRVKPECPCADGIDSKACVGCEHSEDGKKKYRPYESPAEMIVDFIDRFKVNCPSYCEPLIWLKGHNTDNRYLVTCFPSEFGVNLGNGVRVGLDLCGFQDLFKCYTYLDGSPVGMEVKE